MSQHDVFISYDSSDQVNASSLMAGLRYHGFSCWMDTYRIFGGEQIPEAIRTAIKNCNFLCAVVTPRYAKSFYGRTEAEQMRAREGILAPVRFIPCLFECPPPSFLGERAYIDFCGDFERALHRLVASLRTHQANMNQRSGFATVAGIATGAIALGAILGKFWPDDTSNAQEYEEQDDLVDVVVYIVSRARVDVLRDAVRERIPPSEPVPRKKVEMARLLLKYCDLSDELLDELFSADELRSLCRALEKSTAGTKATLIRRILDFLGYPD